MQAYETSATVQTDGQLAIAGIPFPPGTAVDVMITPKRVAADEFAKRWQELTQILRSSSPREIEDDEIQAEIDDYRARR
jgi:hypothetical protein